MSQSDQAGDEAPFSYAACVADSILLLNDIHEGLQTVAVNLCVQGELKEYAALFDEGEDMPIDPAVFESVSDPQVKHLYKLMRLLDESADSLYNLNPEAARLYDQEDRVVEFFPPELNLPGDSSVSNWAEALELYCYDAVYLLNVQVTRLYRGTTDFCDDWDEDLHEAVASDGNARILWETAETLAPLEGGT